MTTASLFLGRHLMTCLNPPNPLFKGAIRAYGLSIAARLPRPPTPARHLMMPWFPEELRYTASRAVCEERKTVKRLLVAGHDHFSQT